MIIIIETPLQLARLRPFNPYIILDIYITVISPKLN